MYATQHPFRELRDAVLDHEGADLFERVLRPWLAQHTEQRAALAGLGVPIGSPWPVLTPEDLALLYAASRVNDVLLLGFQPPGVSETYDPPRLSIDQYIAFFTALGFQVTLHEAFEPFFHEVVTASAAASPDAPVEVVAEAWPALMLGDLLFSRAGCAVRAGAHALDPQRAQTSTLHWAHRRRHRPAKDLSQGWGGNSQWRTAFRRDYRSAAAYHFNVDGKCDAAGPDPRPNAHPARNDLSPEQRVELVVHRCFVRTKTDDTDLWPWDERHVLPRTASR